MNFNIKSAKTRLTKGQVEIFARSWRLRIRPEVGVSLRMQSVQKHKVAFNVPGDSLKRNASNKSRGENDYCDNLAKRHFVLFVRLIIKYL